MQAIQRCETYATILQNLLANKDIKLEYVTDEELQAAKNKMKQNLAGECQNIFTETFCAYLTLYFIIRFD